MITGIPNGRCFPLAFGMCTRRTGSGFQERSVWCTATAISALVCDDSATCPSTPAVRRPALRWVTCRTLISVFDQDRNIIFCSDRTFAQSCSRVALKILRRSLPTLLLVDPPVDGIPVRHVLGSVHRHGVQLALGSGGLSASAFKGSPAHVSALSGPATRTGIRPVALRPPPGASVVWRRFPLPFGHRHPLLGHPVPPRDSAPLTIGLPGLATRTRPGPRRCSVLV